MERRYLVFATLLAIVVAALAVGGWAAGGDAGQGHSNVGGVSIEPTEQVPTEPPFRLHGQVHYSLDPSGVDDASFEAVTLCLSDSDGAVLASDDLGTFEGASATANVSLETDTVPRYVSVHHPRFHDIDGFDNELLVYRPDEDVFGPGTPGQLPFDYRELSKGSCQPPS